MTALLINDLDRGGAQRALSRILFGLVEKYSNDILLILVKDIKHQPVPNGVEIIVLSERAAGNLISLTLALVRIIRKYRIDRVQSHLYRANFINILAGILGGKHEIQVVNSGRAGRLKSEGVRGRLMLIMQRILYPRADRIICKSRGMARDLELLVPRLKNMTVIPNAYDITKARSNAAGLRRPDSKNGFHIVSLGRLIPLKRHDITIHAVAELKDAGYPVRLEIYGEGESRDGLTELISQLELNDSVFLSGFVDDPFQVLAKAHLLISSSRTEGFPNVLVESMIVGTPVISTDCVSGPREILAPDTPVDRNLLYGIEITSYGVLTAVEDQQAAIDAVKWMIENERERQSMVERSLLRAEEWDIGDISSRYAQILFP